METVIEESSLEAVFATCEKLYHRLNTEFFPGNDPTGKKLVADLEKSAHTCEILIRREHVFSINETIKDILTEDIRYLIIGYYCGFVYQKGMDDRLSRLETSMSYLESFLDVLRRCEVLDKDCEDQYQAYLDRSEKHLKMDGNVLRGEKISRMRKEKECEARLKEIHLIEERKEKGNVVDEELEREKWILALQSCARKSLDDLNMIPQEMEILRYMQSMKDAGKDLRQEIIKDYEAARQKPMQLIRIGTDLKMTKETIKAGVFRPWWNLPTRSMEDYAEEELHHMQEAEAARAAEAKPDRRYKQLEEEGLEDDEELVDRATYKYDNDDNDNTNNSNLHLSNRDRHYEDMMDDISKGIGNTKRI